MHEYVLREHVISRTAIHIAFRAVPNNTVTPLCASRRVRHDTGRISCYFEVPHFQDVYPVRKVKTKHTRTHTLQELMDDFARPT